MNLLKLTCEQKKYLLRRKITEGGIYMLPAVPFYVFKSPDDSCGERIPRNRRTTKISYHSVEMLQFKYDFVEVKLVSYSDDSEKLSRVPPSWVRRHTIEDRNLLEIAIVAAFCYVPFLLKNLYAKFTEKQNDN